VAGRALAFSNPELIRLAKTQFVPVACDDWYQRRREDAEGRFFRGVADQGPRDGRDGSTRQGIYCLTADGHLLVYRNAGQSASATLDELREALHNWEQLPADRRAPGAVQVPDPGPLDGGYTRKPPEGTVILNVFTRALDEESAGAVAPAAACKIGGGKESARDHLWITRDEARQLVPDAPRIGQTFPVPDAIAGRMARFHLVDNTRGEPPFWTARDVRHCEMTLTVVAVSDDAVTMKFTGSVLLSTDADPARASRGYDASLLGDVVFDRHQRTFSKFDVAALGRHWGEGRYTPDARPGRQPLGVVFQLRDGRSPAADVPPQAARELDEYLGRAR
jgi:hypothetical protein